MMSVDEDLSYLKPSLRVKLYFSRVLYVSFVIKFDSAIGFCHSLREHRKYEPVEGCCEKISLIKKGTAVLIQYLTCPPNVLWGYFKLTPQSKNYSKLSSNVFFYLWIVVCNVSEAGPATRVADLGN